ncbi:SDR family oxidoreductase [Sporichthya brevicatena]|uniref:SDR family oxidoreductase n=1 Tax=Sporichthya brevicatena TaxID=171442 RepID=UPI0031E2A434
MTPALGATSLPEFRRRRAVVTGGGSGIGLALTERLVADGASVLAVDVDAGRADSVAAVGGRFVLADVSSPTDWDRVVQIAADDLGGLDLVVLNAGIPVLEPDPLAAPYERIARAYAVNVEGVVHGLRAGVPLLEDGGGDLVVVASLAGLMSYPDDPYYAMTKHAVVGLGLSVARPLAARSVRVTIFCPGVIDTPLVPEAVRTAVLAAGLDLLGPEDTASHLLEALDRGGTGRIWTSQAQLGLVEHQMTKVELPRPPVRAAR